MTIARTEGLMLPNPKAFMHLKEGIRIYRCTGEAFVNGAYTCLEHVHASKLHRAAWPQDAIFTMLLAS